MNRILGLTLVALFAACGGKAGGGLICDNVVPAPAACQSECDPAPGAPNSCPGGFHCEPDGFCDAVCTSTGGECGDGFKCTPDGRCVAEDECVGLECNIVDCNAQGKVATTISGKVFAPNGTLPLFGVTVYVPNGTVDPFVEGATCARCDDEIPGAPLGTVFTNENGEFRLEGIPSGDNIPLVMTLGKWRRQIVIPRVESCTDTAVPASESRFPKNRTEGDIPKIAVSTGSADALECLIRKIGVDDSEIGTAGEPQRIHLYADPGSGGGQGANKFADGRNFADSKTLWGTVDALKAYDIAIFSCEGAQHAETKSQSDMDAVKAYADFGGRVFLSHWHNIWIEGATQDDGPNTPQAPSVWTSIAQWDDDADDNFQGADTIDTVNNPKGNAFASWMLAVQGSTVRGQVDIINDSGRKTARGVDNSKAERWVFFQDGNSQLPQNFQFTTPNEADLDKRCGKVVFSDMHVSAGRGSSSSSPGTPFPGGCVGDLTAQEKALAFMFFDISSCVGQIF